MTYSVNLSSCEELTIGKFVTDLAKLRFPEDNKTLKTVTLHHTTPPSSYPRFSNHNYASAILYVPVGTKQLYQSANGWKNFWNIQEIDIATSNENISVPTVFNVQRTDGGVTIHSDKLIDLSIYNINGQLVKKSRIHGSEQISLPKGFYILSAENQSEKLIIK